MSNKLFCDRCEREIKPHAESRKVSIGEPFDLNYFYADLCLSCHSIMVDIIKEEVEGGTRITKEMKK